MKFDFMKDDGNKSFDNSSRAGAQSECMKVPKNMKEKNASVIVNNDM
jgi:hypothetical protein